MICKVKVIPDKLKVYTDLNIILGSIYTLFILRNTVYSEKIHTHIYFHLLKVAT